MDTTPTPKNYAEDEKMALVASMIGPLLSKIKLVFRNPLKNAKLAQNDQFASIVDLLAEQLVPQYCAANMARSDKIYLMHSLIFLLASKTQSVFTSGVVRTCIDQNWDLKGFKAVLLRILKELGLSSDQDVTKLKEFFDKLIQSQNLQSQSCIKAISHFLKNTKKAIEEDDLKNPVVSFQSSYEFVKADVERYRSQNMKYECFQVLHPWAYDLEQVDFKYVINKDQTSNICRALKSREARVFWLSFFKAQLAASGDEFIGAIRDYCIMNQIPEHFSAQFEIKYKLFMLRTDFAVSLDQNAQEIESIIQEAHHEATRRYSGFSILNGDQVKFPGPGPRQRAPKNELIAEDKLAKAFKIASEQPYYETINMGGIKSWTLNAQQATARLDMSRGTFRVLPNARQEYKLTLRFGSVDTDELKDLEVRFNGDSAQYKVGEGDCNHYVIANDKKLWESQFMIISKDGRFYIRDLGVVHTSRLKVTPNTSLQLHQGSLIDLGKVVHYHVNKLTHELEPVAVSNEQYIVMRGSHSDYKTDDEAILRARPAWVSADENRDMVQNEILLESTVKKTSFDIGRSNKRDVELKLKAVSADHCKIEYTKDKGWLIHEQGKSRLSSNGTFVFMKSHQQMEDHEPSDLIPLFNGMIISFINYELQVKIEPKTTEELSQSKFDPTYPKDLFSGTPRSAKQQVATKVTNALGNPTPGGGMNNFSIPQSQREEVKATSEAYSERFDGTAPAQAPEALKSAKPSERKAPTVDELVDEIWTKYDADESGQLNKRETKAFVLDILTNLQEEPKIADDEFAILFEGMDKDESGFISKEEMKYFIRVARGEEALPPKPEPPAIQDIVEEHFEALQADQETPLTPEQIREKIWSEYDKDGNGTLSKAECRKFVTDLLSRLGEAPKITEEEFNDLFKSFDEDGNGVVSKEEMELFIKQARGEEPIIKVPPTAEEITAKIWSEYDKDGNGTLDKSECRNYVRNLLQRLGEEAKISEEEFEEVFRIYDVDGDGTVSKSEMEHVIRMARGQEVIPKKLTPEEITAQIWAEYDKDGNGNLSKGECRQYVKDLLQRLNEDPKISEEEFEEVFKIYDVDGDGVVSKDEMEHVIRMARGQEAIPKKLTPEEITAQIWAEYDKDGNGTLSKAECKKYVIDLLARLGEDPKISAEDFDEIFLAYDEDGNGVVSKDEMEHVIKMTRGEEALPVKVLSYEQITAQIWAEYDKDGNGTLSKAECRTYVNNLLEKLGENPKISEAEFEEIFKAYDEDGNGVVTRDEMEHVVKMTRGQEALPKKLSPEEITAQIWAEYDRDGNGTLSKVECRKYVRNLLQRLGEDPKVSDEEFEEIFKAYDEDGDGVVTKDEMEHVLRMTRGEEAIPKKLTPEEISANIWAEYDKDGNGTLSKAECRKYVTDLLARLGEEPKVTEEEFNEIFSAYDQDGNGVVTKEEMEHVIRMARGQEVIPKKLSPEEITAQIWAQYDKDGNGTLSRAECRNYVNELLSRLGEVPQVSEEDFNEIFKAYDRDGNGVVTKDEMEHVIRMARGQEAIPKQLSPEEITAQIWGEYDKDGNGTLSKAECRNYVLDLMKRLGEDPKVSEEDFNEIFKAYDRDGNGVVTKEEMEHIIRMARGEEVIPKQLSPEEITTQIWAEYDKDGNGTLSKAECRNYVQDLLKRLNEDPKVSEEDFNEIFKAYDQDGNGVVTKEEMEHIIKQARGEEAIPKIPPTPEEITAQIWAQFDKDGSGALNKTECKTFIKDLLARLGEEPKISEDEFNELFKDFDEDGNGTVSKDEMSLFLRQVKGEEPLPAKQEAVPAEVAPEEAAEEQSAAVEVVEAPVEVAEAPVDAPEEAKEEAPVEAPEEAKEEAPVEAQEEGSAPAKLSVEVLVDQIWGDFDKDGSGSLSKSETRAFVKDLLVKLGEDGKLSEEEFNALFKDFDEDANGTVSKDEMTLFIKQVRGEA